MKTELVKIETLVFDPANARKHGEKNLAAIKSSLQRFGQQKPIVVDANGVVRAGNGTLAAAKALGWKEISIVRSPLSGSEATAYAIADNRTSELAEWDDDVLSQTLAALQIEDEELAASTGFDPKEIDSLTGKSEESQYTAKVRIPIYEITGEKPQLSQLVNRDVYDKMLSKINAFDGPDDVKQFLRFAATRHIVFDYAKIAEYFAHSDQPLQAMMEESALVIIDIDKAIENGFVRMNSEIESMLKDQEDEE
jgi:hypothetical protein